MERKLLLVDDEENILRSLNRLLRRDGYVIHTAVGGQAGLEYLKENDVGVIISDQRMPEMSGVEFLSQVKELYPETVRIVLSGYTDLNSVTDAINEGAIYKFLTKPWEDDLLRKNIQDAFKHYELVYENERLSNELKDANVLLEKMNEQLKDDVRQKSRFMDINLKTLQVSQDVLEHMPMAVMGIGNDNLIALANLKAHFMILPEGGGLVGTFASEVLWPELFDFLTFSQSLDDANIVIEHNDKSYSVWSSKLGGDSNAEGRVLLVAEQE